MFLDFEVFKKKTSSNRWAGKVAVESGGPAKKTDRWINLAEEMAADDGREQSEHWRRSPKKKEPVSLTKKENAVAAISVGLLASPPSPYTPHKNFRDPTKGYPQNFLNSFLKFTTFKGGGRGY